MPRWEEKEEEEEEEEEKEKEREEREEGESRVTGCCFFRRWEGGGGGRVAGSVEREPSHDLSSCVFSSHLSPYRLWVQLHIGISCRAKAALGSLPTREAPALRTPHQKKPFHSLQISHPPTRAATARRPQPPFLIFPSLL